VNARIPAGTIMRRTSAPSEAYVVVVADVNPGDVHATVRYLGGQGFTWTEPVSGLVQPRFNAVAF